MKIRTGFVANSSSSSFLVALPAEQDLEPGTLITYLFGYKDNLDKVVPHGQNRGAVTWGQLAIFLADQFHGQYQSMALSEQGILEYLLWGQFDIATAERQRAARAEAARLEAKGRKVYYLRFETDAEDNCSALLCRGFEDLLQKKVRRYDLGA